ncbi:hypothetical protein ACEF07_10025, partial [Streptococcus dysgalactiae]
HLYHSRMGFFFHHLRGETKKVIIRLPLGSFRRFQLKSMNYSGIKDYLSDHDIYSFNWLKFANYYKISTSWGQEMIQDEFKKLI